jgi:hypothetical protein
VAEMGETKPPLIPDDFQQPACHAGITEWCPG